MTTLQLTQIPTVKAQMLIRRPAAEVFQAFADPDVTTRFWYTRGTGKMTPGANLRWDWEMYGLSTAVRVHEVEEDSRIRFEWNDDQPMTVEFRFTPWENSEATFVEVMESGLGGTGDEILAHAAESTAGFSMVLCAAKALLEHGVELAVVRDHFPAGVEV